MTIVYFVRHAEPDYRVHEDDIRPLTEKGMQDRALVSTFLADKDISVVVSSPFKRAYDTIAAFANSKGLEIMCVDSFRERSVADVWIDDFTDYAQRQWEDFDYKIQNGESLREVQTRNISALFDLLEAHPNQSIVVGTHGTALSTIVHYFDPTFNYERFSEIVKLMPWVVQLVFDGNQFVSVRSINLFAHDPCF